MRQTSFEVENHSMMIRGTAYLPDASGAGTGAGAAGGRFPTVLMLHGFTGQRMENGFLFVRLARRLAGRGVAAVTFDFRHSGESDGSFDQMLVTGELDDALRMTQWLAGQPFADRSRMALLGFSLGGLLAACTAGRTSLYRALVLVAPTTEKNLARLAREKGEPATVGPHTLHKRFFEDLATLNAAEELVKHSKPTLLVQGDADQAVPPNVSQAYVDAMNRLALPVEQRIISGADHGFSAPPARAQLIDAVADWLPRQLATR